MVLFEQGKRGYLMLKENQIYRMNSTFNPGYIECIVGTMFSGKSRELLYRGMRAEEFGDVKVLYFKPTVDTRDDEFIKSRDGMERRASLFSNGRELLNFVNGVPSLILIDEVQFCDESLIYAVQLLKFKGHNIVLSGLHTDFRGQPFGIMPQIMALSDTPIKSVFSVCNISGCHNDGVLPQRLRNGLPDSALSPTIIIEGSSEEITYEPRCADHHIVPDIDRYLLNQLSL